MSPSRRPKSRKGSVGQASLASAHGGTSPWNTDMLLVQARQKMMKKKRDRSTNSAGDSGPSSEQDSVDGKQKIGSSLLQPLIFRYSSRSGHQ